MQPEFFDIHSHLNFPDYNSDREEVIKRLKETNTWTTTIGTSLATSKEAVELANTHENLFASIGVHPADDPKERFDPDVFAELVQNPKVIAIGECGLDYGREGNVDTETKQRQKEDFEAQIEFAVKHERPLMIHCRSAYEDVLDMLESKKRQYGDKLWGNMHFFAGGIPIAKRCLDINFSISFTGVITFVKDYEEMVAYPPEEMIMAETDAPFVAPVPYRGKRNESTYVAEVVKKIAEIRKIPLETAKKQLVANALRIFRIRLQ